MLQDNLHHHKDIILVAAIGRGGVIGYKNTIPWHLPADLAHFKQLTRNQSVVMGRKTFESLKRPLPQRENLVVTKNKNFRAPGCIVCSSLEQAIQLAESQAVMIIGGESLYEKALPLATCLYLTYIDIECAGDTFFPPIDPKQWFETEREDHSPDAENSYPYCFVTLKHR